MNEQTLPGRAAQRRLAGTRRDSESASMTKPARSTAKDLLLCALTLAAVLPLAACSRAPAESRYTPPTLSADGSGQQRYVDAPVIDAAAARQLNPDLSTAEGAVIKFLASRLRGDAEWRQALVADPSSNAERALAEWEQWQLDSFQLRGRSEAGPDRLWLSVHFQITVDGQRDGGEDEFEVRKDGRHWRIVRPPS